MKHALLTILALLGLVGGCDDESSSPGRGSPSAVEQSDPAMVASPNPAAALEAVTNLCNLDGWCWSRPLARGMALHAMQRIGDELWIVGAHRAVLRWDGTSWSAPTLPRGDADFTSVVGTGADDVWITGATRVYHFDGRGWTATVLVAPQDENMLHAAWASGRGDVWVGAENGFAYHYDGKSWQEVQTQGNVGESQRTESSTIWSSGPDDVWFGGRAGTLVHYDGRSFVRHRLGGVATIHRIWGTSARDVWAAGQNGLLFRFDGVRWSAVESSAETITAVHGRASDDVWLSTLRTGTRPGEVRHWDGHAWTSERLAGAGAILDIRATPDHVWTLGSEGELSVRDAGGWHPIVSSRPAAN